MCHRADIMRTGPAVLKSQGRNVPCSRRCMPPPTPKNRRDVQPDIELRVRALDPWYHNLELAGVHTAPDHFLGNYPKHYFQYFSAAVPADLSGWTVLDIGCNAGFYSFEMKRRRAARVVGLEPDPRYLA